MVSRGGVKGIAHITGGGFTDNIPRIFPEGLGAVVNTNSWEVPSIFKWIKKSECMKDSQMFQTFNMGIWKLKKENKVEVMVNFLAL